MDDQIKTLKQVEAEHIAFVIRVHHYCLSVAARSLGISRAGLYRKIKTYNLDRSRPNG